MRAQFLLLAFASLPVCSLLLFPDSIAYAGSKTVRAYVTNFGGKTVNTTTWGFDKETVGKLPRGFSSQVTGKGVAQKVFESITSKGNRGQWEIVEDKTAPSSPFVLAQTSDDNFAHHFNLAVVENTNYRDLELEVKFKAVSGKEDQGGGPVWRYQDPDNYYIARANPLESNFRFYKVINGNRKQLASANLKVTTKEWHSIKIRNRDNHIECFYDGEKYLDINDDVFETGKIGLWTKADAVTCFDDLKVKRY